MKFDLRDAVGLVGLSLLTAGVAMVHVPSALIVCGAFVLLGVLLSARSE